MIILLVLLGIIIIKLTTIQILDSEKYRIIAKKQSQSREIIAPVRGGIFDRNMNSFVSNVFRVSVIADPYKIKNADTVSTILSLVFNKSKL
jgi:cell division protein FtsI/penicillin-binding protein 2